MQKKKKKGCQGEKGIKKQKELQNRNAGRHNQRREGRTWGREKTEEAGKQGSSIFHKCGGLTLGQAMC